MTFRFVLLNGRVTPKPRCLVFMPTLPLFSALNMARSGHRGMMDLKIVLQLHDRNKSVIWCPDHGNSNAIAFREFHRSVHG